MSLAAHDLDVFGDLAAALGLVDASGSFEEGWLSDPGRYLSEVLADAHQRESLVAFVDEVLGGEARTIGPDGSTWLPIVERNAPDLKLYLVLDDRAASSVAIGVGVRYATTGPRSSTTAHVPLFRVAKKGQSVPSSPPSPTLPGTCC
ncbi:MAG TPA: hypothetical protein VLL75_18875 [Vicinamibacteria bacterium]|nr:hypothetical protein [Vicinamibacteria bacterium]